MLKPNIQAPEFISPNQHGTQVSLADFRGAKNVLLYFYPKDDTPGRTIEANQFTALAGEFAALDTVVIGVSRDSCESHQAFISKYALGIDLFADTDGGLCKLYGVWQEKEKNGEKKMGIVRSTFLIDKQGQLVEALYGVTAEGHAAAMLESVRKMSSVSRPGFLWRLNTANRSRSLFARVGSTGPSAVG
jgi:peroxiredoxin Q/BCP